MILNETKPQLFYQGEDLFKKIEKALSCASNVSLDICLWKKSNRIEYTVYAADPHSGPEHFPVYCKTFPELLAWLKQKELLLQKIEL